jgi:hypothetical protein
MGRHEHLADIAHEHLGEPGPNDTCLAPSTDGWGGRRQPLPTESVSAAVQLASRAATAGPTTRAWTGCRWATCCAGPRRAAADPGGPQPRTRLGLHQGTGHGNLQRSAAAARPARWRCSRRVRWVQPAPHVPGVLPGAAGPRAPAPAKPAPSRQAQACSCAQGHHPGAPATRSGQLAEAHHTTVAAFLRANPTAADGRSHDFHILRADLIMVGQRLHLP